VHDAVGFKLTELRSQDLLANASKELAKFGEALWPEPQMPDRKDLPFAAKGVDGSLHGAAVMFLHSHSRLTKLYVLLADAE
jgi:hypothetical protein